MIQRLLVCGAALLVLTTSPAFGVGLGSLDLQSALNQQFVAEIELTNVRGLDVEEILPRLASQEDFDRVGVERNYALTDLRFKVVPTNGSGKLLRVTSTRPVNEPFLNFLVEVLWPNGRILREYTVLLDPPVFTDDRVTPLQTATASSPQSFAAAPAIEPSVTPVPTRQPVNATEIKRGRIDDGEYGVTGVDDTLWQIALEVRPNRRVSVQQTMLALQRSNPDAFINNNINLLKAGYVLRIPDEEEIQRETKVTAVDAVRVQNDDFGARRSSAPVTQLDATSRQPQGQQSRGRNNDEGELRLVSAENSDADDAGQRAGSNSSASGATNSAMAAELALAREDIDRTQSANSELNARMDDLARQIETLSEIVKLKDDQLAALRAEVQRAQDELANAAVNKPKPSNASAGLLADPFVLGGLGLLLISLVAGGLIYRKRRQDKAMADNDESENAVVDSSSAMDDSLDSGDVIPAGQLADIEDDASPQTTDVMGEVEIYIAYGRFPQAISFLQKAIAAEPGRSDIRLKLLEVYVETEDAAAFNVQLEALRQMADDQTIEQALALQAKIPGAAESEVAAMSVTTIESTPTEDDLSFDLDDLDSETDDSVFDFNSNDDVELDSDGAETPVTNTVDALAPQADDLELADDLIDDLDLDLDLDGESLTDDVAVDTAKDMLKLDGEDALELDEDFSFSLDEADLDEDLDLLADKDSPEDDTLKLDDLDDDSFNLDLDDEDFNLDDDIGTKLNLARAYIDMDDEEAARKTLQEIIVGGSDTEIEEAKALLEQIS